MAAVGGVACDSVTGSFPRTMKARYDVFHVPGQDGVGMVFVGNSATRWSAVAIHHGSDADIESWIASLEAVQKAQAPVTVVDNRGISHANLVIVEMENAGQENHYRPGTNVTTKARITLTGHKVA